MMEEFVLTIDTEKFRSTNGAWNRLMLNDPWSVGYVSQLIETKEWKSKEEWEEFYYNSGKERQQLLGSNSSVLNNDSLQLNKKDVINNLPWNLKNLNYQYGRTKEDFMSKALKLQKETLNLSIDECYECVRYRTICETWNGIIVREANTIVNLSAMFPNLIFKKTDGVTDHTFAVDYEVFSNGILKFGIQIKPKSYTFNAPYLQKARFANQQKYEAYFKLKGVKVLTVISKGNGEILNDDVIQYFKNI